MFRRIMKSPWISPFLNLYYVCIRAAYSRNPYLVE
jgi:hypothetical protein